MGKSAYLAAKPSISTQIWYVFASLWWAIALLPRNPRQKERVLADRAARILTRHRAPAIPSVMGSAPATLKCTELGVERAMWAARKHPLCKHVITALARERDDEVLADARAAEAVEVAEKREFEQRRRATAEKLQSARA
jgi:hypothetical protein